MVKYVGNKIEYGRVRTEYLLCSLVVSTKCKGLQYIKKLSSRGGSSLARARSIIRSPQRTGYAAARRPWWWLLRWHRRLPNGGGVLPCRYPDEDEWKAWTSAASEERARARVVTLHSSNKPRHDLERRFWRPSVSNCSVNQSDSLDHGPKIDY